MTFIAMRSGGIRKSTAMGQEVIMSKDWVFELKNRRGRCDCISSARISHCNCSFHIIEKVGCDSCTIKSTTKYEINDDELAKKVSPLISVDSLVNMARGISKYVLKNQSHKHQPKKEVHEHGHPSADEGKHVHPGSE
ncbi:hypothetical protein C5167_011477 [Papaver somniferum]|uniref:Uncharacterized protein n=1 Tax=Papaver somniferum TaxID=3469 RepID=A0A4Y7K4E6_PAPSO|nr:hypothetical protein C5167_011477 [Papaver somniferum]